MRTASSALSDAMDFDDNHCPGACEVVEMLGQGFKFLGTCFMCLTYSMKSHDTWSTFEGTHHDDDTSVFSEVCDGFRPAACVVEISDFPRAKYPEGVQSFGRAIDMPSPERGADATKNIFWLLIHSRMESSMVSKTFAIVVQFTMWCFNRPPIWCARALSISASFDFSCLSQ